MNNLLKHLALMALASLCLPGGVFAQTLTITGTVTPNTCVLKFFNSSTSQTALTSIQLPTISVADLGTTVAVGFPATNNNGTPVFIKAQTSAGAACNTGISTTGGVGTFNVLITGTPDTLAAKKVGNATTAALGGATGVTIDLVPATGTLTGLDITAPTSALNHGQAAVSTGTALQFTAKYYKTAATGTAATSGSLSVPFTVTASWL